MLDRLALKGERQDTVTGTAAAAEERAGEAATAAAAAAAAWSSNGNRLGCFFTDEAEARSCIVSGENARLLSAATGVNTAAVAARGVSHSAGGVRLLDPRACRCSLLLLSVGM